MTADDLAELHQRLTTKVVAKRLNKNQNSQTIDLARHLLNMLRDEESELPSLNPAVSFEWKDLSTRTRDINGNMICTASAERFNYSFHYTYLPLKTEN